MKNIQTTVQNLIAAARSARRWARAHKMYVTVGVIVALHGLTILGVNLPAKDIEHAVSAIIGG